MSANSEDIQRRRDEFWTGPKLVLYGLVVLGAAFAIILLMAYSTPNT